MKLQVVVRAANGDILQRMEKTTFEWGRFELNSFEEWGRAVLTDLLALHPPALLSQLYDGRALSAFVVGRF